MKAFFDVNVLLELLLPGRENPEAAIQALQAVGTRTISPLSVHLYVYFGQKQGFPLDQLLIDAQRYELTSMGAHEVAWAVKNRQNDDFEDALQVACAVLHGCRTFVTFDQKLARDYQRFIDMIVL